MFKPQCGGRKPIYKTIHHHRTQEAKAGRSSMSSSQQSENLSIQAKQISESVL